ncbi:DUF433 domain-containing protein [Acidobacteria bacterium AH-259-L09]|nr:DUF433 domain-containing protein [Acidobacteria bacterium AH-259-L09]
MDKTLGVTDIIHSDPEIMHGTPVFKGTRVPVQALIDHLESGDSLDVFLESFPSVTREQAVAFIELASRAALAEIRESTSR